MNAAAFTKALALLIVAAAAGCERGAPPQDLADAATPGFPAAHAPLPQVIPHGGLVLKQVRLVTITYDGDPHRATVEAFGELFFGSNYFHDVAAEYALGTGAQLAKLHLPGPAPPTVTAAQLLGTIGTLADAGLAPAPTDTPTDQVLYLFYVPQGTTVTDPIAGAGCASFEGFHRSTRTRSTRTPFAVVSDCTGDVDRVTSIAAHELVEAASDPYPGATRAWTLDAALPDPWYAAGNLELADLCDGEPDAREGGYALQPVWSNSAAALGLPPCTPATDPSYFGLDVQPATAPSIAAGASVTFTVTGWSLAPTPDWDIAWRPAVRSDLSGTELSPTLSDLVLNNGRAVKISLRAPADAASGQIGAIQVFAAAHPSRMIPLMFVVK